MARQEIHQLREKVHFLLTHEVPCRKCGVQKRNPTPNALFELLKETDFSIHSDSLQDALRKPTDKQLEDGALPGDGKLGPDHQKRLAGFYGFQVGWPHNQNGWPEWIDPKASEETPDSERQDTAKKFIARYCHEFGESDPDEVEMLMEGPPNTPQRTPGLASVEMMAGQIGEGTADLGVSLSCGFLEVPNSRYYRTLRSARLQINCGEARARMDTVKGYNQPRFEMPGSHGAVSGRWYSGTSRELDWRLDAQGVSLGNVKMEIGFVALERLNDGSSVVATVGTWLKDIDPVDEQTDTTAHVDEIAFVDADGQEVRVPAEQLSREQRRFIEHLQLAGLDLDEQNFAHLASHEITFVRRPK